MLFEARHYFCYNVMMYRSHYDAIFQLCTNSSPFCTWLAHFLRSFQQVPRMPSHCFAFGCSHVSSVNRTKMQDLRVGRIKKKRQVLVDRPKCMFYRFPSNSIEFRKWEKFCRRADRKPSRASRLCSCHFEGGVKGEPSFHFWKQQAPSFSDPEPRSRKSRKRTMTLALEGKHMITNALFIMQCPTTGW